MSRQLKEEELASGLLKYIVIALPFLMVVLGISVRILDRGAFSGDLIVYSNDDPDNGELMMPRLMAYLAACVINAGLNLLFFLQFSSRIRALGPKFQMINYLAPGLLFVVFMLIREGFDLSMQYLLIYFCGLLNLFFGYLVWKSIRHTEVVA